MRRRFDVVGGRLRRLWLWVVAANCVVAVIELVGHGAR
jgi:hypothetical protein